MKKLGDPKPPEHLEPETAEWWLRAAQDFELEGHHERLLTGAAEAWDRAQQARRILEEEGIVVPDRFGQPKPHPAVAIERDSKALFARLLRELAFDVEPPAESRPPSVAGRAGLRVGG